jgi:hypothetical protein
MTDHILEPAAQQLADATSKPPATAAVEHAIHILQKALHA